LDNDLLLDDTNIYCIGTNLTGMVIIIFGLDSEATKHQALFEHRLYYVLKQVNKNENIQCFEYNTAFTYDIENILTEHNKITKQLIKIDLFSLFNKHYTRKPILKSKCVNWDMKKKLDVLLQQKSFSIDNLSQVVYGLNDSKIHAEWYNILSSYNPYIIYNFLVSIENTNKISIRAKETLKYINEHLFDGQPTLDNIAHHMYLDKSYLARLFKSEFNITVGEYVQKKRLEHSVSLLEGTDLPIKDIAVKSGYTNINYFTRVFKSHYNIPPNQYRRENQE
jgi:AraC-like DNA-binding protein